MLLNEGSYYEDSGAIKLIHNMAIERIVKKAQAMAHTFLSFLQPIPLFEQKYNPRTYSLDCKNRTNLAPLFSLTTMSSRISRVETTIEGLLGQDLTPHSINLYVSQEPHLLDKGIKSNNDDLIALSRRGINIYLVPNIGPYRKIIPIISQLKSSNSPPDTPIITFDDDVLYPSNIARNLLDSCDGGYAVVAHRGRKIVLDKKSILSYERFTTPSISSSHFNIANGKNGILYLLKQFPDEKKHYIGHILAPTADDIWCKWITSAYGIPTKILEPDAAFMPHKDYDEVDKNDKNSLFHFYNAKGVNNQAMTNIEGYFSFCNLGLFPLLSSLIDG